MPKTITPKDLRAFKVFAIEEGTVIDHIKAGNALKIIRLLNLAEDNKIVSVGLNFSSKKMRLKDVIKVEKRELTPEEIGRVAIFAPEASINIIRNYKVAKKFKAQIPEVIEYVITCPNPKCITNNESVMTKFAVSYGKDGIHLRCHYCEKEYQEDEITNYKSH
jgi:aspartate carbamoyltransferase regulatory subunit